jgi:alkylresorcinol/alkylpyrone synthase
MPAPACLLSVATASPPHELTQSDAVDAARGVFGPRFPAFERMIPVFHNAGVRARQLVMPMDWYLQPRGWPDRNEAFLAGALDLFCAAAQRALDEAGLKGADIDAIVSVTSTGVATPSLEARAMGRMGFRSDAARIPLFGVGCAGGATGLALASRLAAAEPGCKVLLVCVELCSLAFRLDEPSKTDIVSTAIFGDGAAACVLSGGGEGFARVTGRAEHTWPDTLDVMGWRVDPMGLGVILTRSLPPFVEEHVRPAMESMLGSQGLALDDVDRFICHPGGAKIIEAIEMAFGLGQGTLDHEREVLADHGNMSSPTVLFILDRARRAGLPARSVVAALGPGFTASTVTLAAA